MVKRYCAFMRGMNIGRNVLKSADVCHVFRESGMQDVSSLLVSGNILFSTDQPRQKLRPLLEEALSAKFNYAAVLFLKTPAELNILLERCPFAESPEMHIYGFIHEAGVEMTLMPEFEAVSAVEEERAEVRSGAFYWQVPKGSTLDTPFAKVLGKKALRDQFTSRNLNTLRKVAAKLG